MTHSASFSHQSSQELEPDLARLVEVVRATADGKQGNCLALLELLRLLENLHFEIRDTLFREALPDNRQRLYQLLKDIEQEGGWPYINRMHLRELLEHLNPDELENEAPTPTDPRLGGQQS
ncbi:MAG: hypothetical protein AAFR58_11215 [Cyanobacteria bacterium J06627_28]